MKKRHKILLGLMLAVTTVMIGVHIYVAVMFSQPETLPQALSYQDMVFLNTLRFIPVYLGVLLLWAIGVKIAEFIRNRR